MYSQTYPSASTVADPRNVKFLEDRRKNKHKQTLEVYYTNTKQIFSIWISLCATTDINQRIAIIL